MIRSKDDLSRYIKEDQLVNSYKGGGVMFDFFHPNPIQKFLKHLRYCEYLINVKTAPLRWFRLLWHKYQFRRLSVRLGYTIAYNCFGEGLHLPHYGGIIVNGNVKIGKHCSIRPFTVIGNKRDGMNKETPVIGDYVQIGCNVSIIGGIIIGDHVVIGAGTVVTKSVPDNCCVVGNPQRIISNNKNKIETTIHDTVKI